MFVLSNKYLITYRSKICLENNQAPCEAKVYTVMYTSEILLQQLISIILVFYVKF